MSTDDAMPFERIGMHEGSIGLPPGFEDRSANIFVPADPQNQPNLSIARDWLIEGETLATYVDRQLCVLKSRIPNHKVVARIPDLLGQGNPACVGERIEAQYKNGAQTIRQRQAAFLVGPKRALILTAASPRAFDDKFEGLWRSWLDSFIAPTQAAADTAPVAP
ncbi:DcrB-related protein [Massilia mucilaginosa]|nr:DUF1795 domain-containing protein [Massilia mucilaginosa]